VYEEELKKLQNILRKEGRFFNQEFHSRSKSGEIRIALGSAEMINIGGKSHRIVTITDITERKQAEKALQESEERFSKAFNTASDAMCIMSSDGGFFLAVNESYVKLSGYSRDELIGRNPDNLEMWANPGERMRFLTLVKEQGRLEQGEFGLRIRSGEERTCLFSLEPINIGGKRHMIVVVQDVTERNQAETALRLSEEKFSKAFSASLNPICILTLNGGKFTEVNDSYLQFTGYSREEIIGRNAAELNLWVNKEESRDILKKLLEKGKVFNFEINSRMKSGEIRTALLSSEIINISGDPCMILVLTDISERKRAEEKLKHTLTSLEQSSTRLEAANKELEAFSYSVSHDLRSPLRSIDGFSQAMLEDYADVLDETGRKYLKRLRNASQKMGELIDGLLKLSRLSRSEMSWEQVDLSSLASEIVSRLQETQPKQKAEISISSGLTASGDPQLLRVLLENLLGNAWKFTAKVPLVKIEFGAVRNGTNKTFFVKDNGAGFDMSYVDKLFGVFQRLHDVTDFPGTGIGLATVRRIINRHGGTVRAEGEVGNGATFYFTLN
jgi:PAS domain S-box-containing protein